MKLGFELGLGLEARVCMALPKLAPGLCKQHLVRPPSIPLALSCSEDSTEDFGPKYGTQGRSVWLTTDQAPLPSLAWLLAEEGRTGLVDPHQAAAQSLHMLSLAGTM